MKTRTRWITGIVSVGVVVAGVYGYGRARKPTPVHYETAKVERGKITARVTATGTLSATVTVLVGSQVSGRIQKLNADFNSPVRKGEVIAKIDPQLFNASVEQARANYVAAAGNLEKLRFQALDAKRQYERSKALAERKLIAQADLDTAQVNMQSADAQVGAQVGLVAQAKAALHTAEINLAYTTIVSPIDGTVISRSVDVGQTVAASLAAPTLFTIAEDLRKMQVDTSVAEADVGKLRPDMPATFTVDAYPTEKFKGKVRQIRNAPQTVQNVVTYDAVLDVQNHELKLKPGMTANVTFIYAEKDAVLKVPNAALRFRPAADVVAAMRGSDAKLPRGAEGAGSSSGTPGDGGAAAGAGGAAGAAADAKTGASARRPHGKKGPEDPTKKTVWVLRGANPEPVTIRVGVSDGSVTEILEGEVKEGDAIVTEASGLPAAGGPPGGAQPFRRMF